MCTVALVRIWLAAHTFIFSWAFQSPAEERDVAASVDALEQTAAFLRRHHVPGDWSFSLTQHNAGHSGPSKGPSQETSVEAKRELRRKAKLKASNKEEQETGKCVFISKQIRSNALPTRPSIHAAFDQWLAN